MNQFKIGDRVRAVKDVSGWFTIGQIGTVEGANEHHIFVTFDNGREAPVKVDEIELIESEPTTQNPFPTFNEFHEWYRTEQGNMQGVYHYFAQFGKQPRQPNSKPFPWIGEAINDLKENVFGINTEQFETIYNYFSQFGVREVFPEVGKEYEFSEDGENWRRDIFESYESNNSIGFTHIRPIQPSRLEQLMEKHPNLTDTEQTELLHLLLTQNKQNK
jgi:hypothetical protein